MHECNAHIYFLSIYDLKCWDVTVALAAMGSRGAAATRLAAADYGGQCSVGGVMGCGVHLGERSNRRERGERSGVRKKICGRERREDKAIGWA
jgi:hypothetical protein